MSYDVPTEIDGLVAPPRAGRSLRPRRSTFARWDRRLRVARFDLIVALPRVIRAVTADGVNRHVCGDLIEKTGQRVGIGDVLMHHRRRAYLAGIRIHCQMHLAAGAPLRIAVFAHLPFNGQRSIHPLFQERRMRDEKFDLIKFSSQVRDLLDAELQISVGNMEVVPFAEKLYKLVRAQAYNEGILDAKRVMERKVSDISEQLDILLQYE